MRHQMLEDMYADRLFPPYTRKPADYKFILKIGRQQLQADVCYAFTGRGFPPPIPDDIDVLDIGE